MIIAGIFDRVRRIITPSYIVMPVWTGVLILITASMGVAVGTKLNLPSNSALVITYRALNVFCSILCGFILFWYGAPLSTYGQLAQLTELEDRDKDSFAVVAIIFVMALAEVFLSIMGILASQERNSSYMQLVDPPMEPYNNQTRMHVPLNQVGGNNYATSGGMQGATAYYPMAQPVLQAGAPVMMAPAYLNQMGSTKAPVMLVPAQNLQQMPGTSGGGLMYVQVPANQVLSANTQESTPSHVPQVTTYPSGPQSPEEAQGII
ncbi:hypothetical protein ACROYT_G030743 [Oculina patagonica]